MPVHSVIFITYAGNIIYSKYFLDAAVQDYNTRLFFEQRLYKLTSPSWRDVASGPVALTIADVVVVYKQMGDFLAFACGTDDVDEGICECELPLHGWRRVTDPLMLL
jgi:hypothetical protein